MKRLLLCLVPWMAMTAVARPQDTPREVEVLYSNVGPAEAWRVGDECYIAPSVLTAWHWPFTMNGSEATIQAEGRTVMVPTKVVHEQVLIPAKAIFDQLGATCRWHGDELDVLGQVRIISIKNRMLEIDTTISCKPHLFSLSDPSRLVLDFRGMTLPDGVQGSLPPGVTAAQEEPDTVRVVYQADDVPSISSTLFDDATRSFQYSLRFPKPGSQRTGIPDLVNPVTAQNQSNGDNSTPAAPGSVPALAPVVSDEGSDDATISVPISGTLSESVQVRRINPYQFEVTLPGAAFTQAAPSFTSDIVRSLSIVQLSTGAMLRIETRHPAGIEVSENGRSVEISLARHSAAASLVGRTIVIDPGHGGQDSGTRSPDHSVDEKELTLEIGTDVAADLASAGATVIMTRKSDVFIPLKERSEIANRNNADLFVSIHVNSNALLDSKRAGTTTYYHGDSSQGRLLAQSVSDEVAAGTTLDKLGAVSDLSRFPHSGMAVLRYSHMPAILIETGYMTNPLDREKLKNPAFQQELARAIVQGIKVYFGDVKENAN